MPTARRATACVLVRRGGDRLLFDCGEGAQRQMHRSTGLVQLDEIYLTHFHADHYLGIPGLLKTYDLQDRERPLRIYGPPGSSTSSRRSSGSSAHALPGRADRARRRARRSSTTATRCAPIPVEHRIKAFGYALVEDDRPGRFDPEAAARLGVEAGPAFGALQRGEEVEGSDGTVQSAPT